MIEIPPDTGTEASVSRGATHGGAGPAGKGEDAAQPAPSVGGRFTVGNDVGRRWRPGESGNPDGRPRGPSRPRISVRQLEEDARESGTAALLTLKTIMLDRAQASRDRIRAAELVLAYGMGKPRQSISVSGEEGKPPVLVDSITVMLERMIAAGATAPGQLVDLDAITADARVGAAEDVAQALVTPPTEAPAPPPQAGALMPGSAAPLRLVTPEEEVTDEPQP